MSLLRRLEHAASGRYGTEQASIPTRAPDVQTPSESLDASSTPTVEESAFKQEAVPQALSSEAPVQEPPEVHRTEEAKSVAPHNKNLTALSSSPEPAVEKAVEAEITDARSVSAHPERREHTTAPLAPKKELEDSRGQLWHVTVAETSGEPSFAGPLGMETLAASHLAAVEPESPLPEAKLEESKITAPHAHKNTETSLPSHSQPGSSENEPFQLVPEPSNQVETETSSAGATLTIGQIDLKIAPPPKPLPQQNAPRPAPKTKQRHGKGLSVSSQMRRAGLRRL